MADQITIIEEIKQWTLDNNKFGNKTALERRAEKILKEVLINIQKEAEENLPTHEIIRKLIIIASISMILKIKD